MRTKKVFGRTGARSRLFEQLSAYRIHQGRSPALEDPLLNESVKEGIGFLFLVGGDSLT